MKRKVYVWDSETQTVVEAKSRKSSPELHYIITDEMDAAAHPCDGRMYTSKSEFRKTTRAHNCVEIGNEKVSNKEVTMCKQERREDVKRTMQQMGFRI